MGPRPRRGGRRRALLRPQRQSTWLRRAGLIDRRNGYPFPISLLYVGEPIRRKELGLQKLTKWGNSTGLRLPASVMEAAGLEAGDYVYVRLLDTGDIRVRPVKNPQLAVRLVPEKHAGTTAAPTKDTKW